MAKYNPLNWQNENAISNYPLSYAFELQDFIVDARFVQFDNFVPVLDYVMVENDRVRLAITFDHGQQTNIEYVPLGNQGKCVRIYQSQSNRYMGLLVFGGGASTLISTYAGQTVSVSTPFLASTVRSIPLKDAVYTLDGSYGDVVMGRTMDDKTIFYSVHEKTLIFNAVTLHEAVGAPEGLRKINLVPPVNNNINISYNDVIKLSSFSSSSITIDLVSGSPSSSFTLPTLVT